MKFSPRQAQSILYGNSRWNIDSGATRSGKTHVSYWKILKRLKELPEGNRVMIGKTLSTLSYNVLDPMRVMLGEQYVSTIRKRADGINSVFIFGKELRVVGADNKRSVTKIQGSGLIYAYGDEIATWDEGVFQMLKSRLDSKDACFDGTTNPDAPNHWLKQFIDESIQKGIDLHLINYKIDDNTFLDQEFIDSLKKEYFGTVYYDRFINGRWVAAEGSIYTTFISSKDEFIIDELPANASGFISIGVDFGGNKSGHAFNATLVDFKHGKMYTIADYWKSKQMDTRELEAEFINFVKQVKLDYPKYQIANIQADSAEQVLINGFKSALATERMGFTVTNAIKGEINERIRLYTRLFGSRSYFILKRCKHTIKAFEGAVWRETLGMKDERLDDGTSNIDTIDAQEYSTEKFGDRMLKIIDYRR